jgi:peptide/nickel transport system permease protein
MLAREPLCASRRRRAKHGFRSSAAGWSTTATPAVVSRAAYIRRRLFLSIFVLFGVTIVIFGMVHFLPGDPAMVLLGDRATTQNMALLREQLGLNRSLPEQYWLFVSGLVQGQMGTSLMFRQPVRDMVLSRVPISIGLAVYAMTLAAVFTFVFGLLAAAKKDRWVDQVIRVVFLLILTTPNFWFGILLILVLSLGLKWFPVAGFGSTLQEHMWYLFLPALTLGLQLSAVLIRNLRSQVIVTSGSDFVRTARAKGLLERVVLLRHVLRNALLSTVTIFGLQFGFLVGGTLVIETVFAVPGMGQLLFTSITSRDYPVVQAITVVSAILVIIVNLLVDLSYSFLDPRVTYE